MKGRGGGRREKEKLKFDLIHNIMKWVEREKKSSPPSSK
jgi:hypothetical protein